MKTYVLGTPNATGHYDGVIGTLQSDVSIISEEDLPKIVMLLY